MSLLYLDADLLCRDTELSFDNFCFYFVFEGGLDYHMRFAFKLNTA